VKTFQLNKDTFFVIFLDRNGYFLYNDASKDHLLQCGAAGVFGMCGVPGKPGPDPWMQVISAVVKIDQIIEGGKV